VSEIKPKWVIIDPISAFNVASNDERVKLMLIRAVDLFKAKGITSLFTALTPANGSAESTAVGISSLMDVWFLLRNLESAGERTRGLYVCKSRGMAHSNQIREFSLTDKGVKLVDVQLDAEGEILTGSARQAYLKLKQGAAATRSADEARRRVVLENRRKLVESKIAAMRAEYEEELHALERELAEDSSRAIESDRVAADLAKQRNAFGAKG
jgi:circadian clock protein KaiC